VKADAFGRPTARTKGRCPEQRRFQAARAQLDDYFDIWRQIFADACKRLNSQRYATSGEIAGAKYHPKD